VQRWRELKEAVEQLDDKEKRVRIEVPSVGLILLGGADSWLDSRRTVGTRRGLSQWPHAELSQHQCKTRAARFMTYGSSSHNIN